MLSILSTSSVGTLIHGAATPVRRRFLRNRRRVVATDAPPRPHHAAADGRGGPADNRHRRNDRARQQQQQSHAVMSIASVFPQPTTLEELYWALRKDQITELRIGWRDSDYLKSHRTISILERALKANTSLRSVSVGWRCNRRDPTVLWSFLGVLTQTTAHRLEHLRICLDAAKWVPEQVLKNLLEKSTRLVSIEFQSVRVLRRVRTTDHYVRDYCCAENEGWLNVAPTKNTSSATTATLTTTTTCGFPSQKFHKREGKCCVNNNKCCGDHSVIRVLVDFKMLYVHSNLKSISLIDCDVTDDNAVSLADYLHIRGGLARLSLRNNNRYLGPRGLAMICQAPVMHQLDLSLCDLGPMDAQYVAASIAKRPWPLGELVLSGNYRMDISGLLALTSQSCCDKLIALNVSYCDIGPHKAQHIIEALHDLEPATTLQQINMQGARFGGPGIDYDFGQGLRNLLEKNMSLRVVRMNDPSNPQNMSSRELLSMLAGLRLNYEVEELQFDLLKSDEELSIKKKMDFFIRLNRAGRRILRSPPVPRHQRLREQRKKEKEQQIREQQQQQLLNSSKHKVQFKLPDSSAAVDQISVDHLRAADEEWYRVLEKAGEDMDVLFWIVRESAERFDRTMRQA